MSTWRRAGRVGAAGVFRGHNVWEVRQHAIKEALSPAWQRPPKPFVPGAVLFRSSKNAREEEEDAKDANLRLEKEYNPKTKVKGSRELKK